MTKRIKLHREEGTHKRLETLRASAVATHAALERVIAEPDPIRALARMKFEPLGHDPLDGSRRLNLIEQLNQTFTYLASFRAAEVLFQRHPDAAVFTLNLGNVSGWDIESPDAGGIVAEVFAAVTPTNNQKLTADVQKLLLARHSHRYVFYMCPGYPPGKVSHKLAGESVVVWSLGEAA